MISGPLPTKPGYYWAKWQIATDGTHEGDDQTPAPHFEIVQVNANCVDWFEMEPHEADYDERLSVSVHGVRETQWPDCFVWGEFIADLKD